MENITLLVLANPTDRELALLEELPKSVSIAVGNNIEAFERAAPEAQVACYWSSSPKLLQPIMKIAPRLEWVHSRSAGLDSVLFPELVESSVKLTNGSGVFSQSLGEFVIGSAIYFAKDFRRLVRNQMEGVWRQFDSVEIAGQTMGIVGYGDIGRACARRAQAMGMRVLGLRRRPELSKGDTFVERVYPFEGLLEMLPQCDYVVAAAPLAPGTRGLIGEEAINAMKQSTVVMNVGRGPVIDEKALIRALESGRIKGAALDVFENEPLPDGHALFKLENVLLSPHCSDHTPTWIEDGMRFFIENFKRYLAGEPLKNVVDKKAGY